MDIIITSPSLDPKINVGGISAVVRFILKNNPGQKYVHFILGKTDRTYRGLSWIFSTVNSWLRWFKLVWEKKHSLIHFNLAMDKRGISRDMPLILYARLLRRPLIIHLHGGEFMSDKDVNWTVRKVIHFLLSGRELVVVLSDFERQLVIDRFGANKVIVLQNSVDLSYAKDFRKQINTSLPLKILFLGRIIKIKGLEDILKALEILHNRGTDFSFVLAGAGKDEAEYCRRFKETLGEKFRFAGVVKGEETIKVLTESDIFLLPSFFEGLPIALLEAMSLGVVPVVTTAGSMGTVIRNGETGLFVDMHSPDSLASAIGLLNTDRELLGKISINAVEYVRQFHDPVKYIEALNSIYERVMNGMIITN